jgi:hypothetical protein
MPCQFDRLPISLRYKGRVYAIHITCTKYFIQTRPPPQIIDFRSERLRQRMSSPYNFNLVKFILSHLIFRLCSSEDESRSLHLE